jgi:DNA primase
MNSNSRFRYWATWKHSLGGRCGNSAAVAGWACPLHDDHLPSFLMDPGKNLFYCYGCGRGGDVIRFAELYHQVRFPEALALLHQWRGWKPLLHEAASFYRMQLHRHGEPVDYLQHRGLHSPELIEHMRVGYAPGGCDAVG